LSLKTFFRRRGPYAFEKISVHFVRDYLCVSVFICFCLSIWGLHMGCAASGNNTVEITDNTGSDGDVVIPETIGGMPVVTIGQYAFNGEPTVTGVTIPSSTTGIDTSIRCEAWRQVPRTIPGAVGNCPLLASVYCEGNAPNLLGLSFYIGHYPWGTDWECYCATESFFTDVA
jgi:hypothetical protein